MLERPGMSAALGWLLAAAALIAGWRAYGWPGVALAATVTVFWLLLQFSRALRVLRKASGAPVGSVGSAVMLHAGLQKGMALAQVIKLAGSLGEKAASSAATEESWRWRDDGGAAVLVHLAGGRVARWELVRPQDTA